MWCRIPSRPSSPWTSCRRTRHSAPGCSGSPTTARWTCCAVIGKLPGSGYSASGRRCRWSRGDGRRVRRSAGWWRRWLRAGSRNHGRIAGDVAEYNRAHESYCRCSIPTTAPAVGPSSSTAPPGSAGDVASMRKLLPLRPGEFNRSTQHYSLEHSSRGAGAIPPLRAKILDTGLVSRAVGRRLPPIGRSSSALRALPLASA
jgi:hypothetical protein